MKKLSLLTFAIMLMGLWLTAQTPCSNLVTNGNFEATTPGFTSALAVNASCVINTYNVTTNFTLKCPNYPTRTDHTTGTGKFLVVQNSTAVNVWQNTVTVTPNAPYTFSFWVANGVTNAMNYAMMVNNVNVNQITVTQATPTWQKYTFSGFCPAGVTSLTIAIKQITFGEAYVYGIDDVSFISCSDSPCIGCTGSVASANLISNGSFTNGDIGFTTGLTYDNNTGSGTSCGAGRYGVYTNFTSFCTGWPSLLDHTNNAPATSRKYMTIDGFDFLAILPVWQSPVNLTANTDYCFSFWWASVYPTSQQSFPVSVDIVTANGFTVVANLGSETIAQSPQGVWVQKTITWNSGSLSGLQYLAIRQPTPNGFSDWGIDDICFTKKSLPPCDAAFTFQNIDNCGNVQFTNTSTPTTGLTYCWDFDNNLATCESTAQNPLFQFPTCGTYNVCLIIAGPTCRDTICQTVTVSDITPPVARCKPGVGVILNANCQYNVTSAFVDNGSTDNCQIKSMVVNPAIIFGCGNTPVTLTVTDWCNNRSTCTMGIQTIETVPPIITCPPTATVSCTKDTIPSVTGTATATDNCPGVITFTHSDIVSGNMPCDATIRRTWTATDACGNSSTCVQSIIVRDNVPPVAICKPGVGVILDANCMYNVTTAFVDGGSTDNCQIQSLSVSPNKITGCGLTTVTLTVTDLCNNKSTCTMGIQTIETVPPIITCPPTASVTCTKDTIPSVTGTATATDNCPGVITFTHSDVVSGNMPCDATIRRTWTARDACGNSSTCVQSIIVRDNVPPVAICKPGVGVILDANCMYNVTTAFVDGGSTDNCQIQSLSVSPNKITGCGLTTVTLTVTDLCNNKSTCTMGIQTIETVPPVIVCPPNTTVTCDNVAQPSLTGTATATDNCPGAVTMTYADVVSGLMPCEGVIRRTWTARDSCGNTSSCVQTISVRDNVPPIITNCPSSQTVNTNAGVCYYTFPTPLIITATDCDPNPVITCTWIDPNGVVSPLTAQTQFPKGINSIKCTARDKCGNVSKDCFFTLTVVDNQPPTITCPLSISVVGSIVAPSTLCKATVNGIAPIATDNCPMLGVNWRLSGATLGQGIGDASGTNFMQGITTVTYTATDMSGNSATCSFTINVKCEPCVASFTYAISGSCNNLQFTSQSGGTPPLTYIWTFGDPNSGATNNTSTAQNPIHQFTGCGTYNVCLYLTTGDGCRDTFCRQIIIDNTAPNMTCPPNLTVACIRDTATSITGKPVVFDNCPGIVSLSYSDVITGTLPCNGIIKRTWTARDICGNTATCVQTITVNDITPPKIICPQSYTVNTNTGVCYFAGALTPTTATDNCDPNPTITCSLLTPTSSILITPQTQFPKGINNISCIARDNCGNTSTACTFTLTVVDNEKPTITCPLSISVVGTQTPPPTLCKAIVNGIAPIVTDNCPMWSVGYTISGATTVTNGISDASGTMFMQGISTVTYTVTDMGGNKATCSFTVTVRCDASQPEFKGFSCGQAIISCFSGFLPGTNIPDPNGPVIAQVDFREHALAPLGTNWAAVSSSSSKIYHAPDWIGQKMGQVFGVTIDAQNNVYAAASTIYGKYMPAPLTNAAFGNVYKIDATTGNVSVLATLPQNLANPAGLGDVWYDAPRTRLLASNFYDGKIYEINPITGSFSVLYDYSITSSATAIGTPSPGFIARGKRVWAIATDANYLYFSVWNEDRGAGRNSTTVNNEIRQVQLVSGVPTGASTSVHNMSNLVTTFTKIYSSPVSDIQFSAIGNMLVAERSMDFDYGDAYSNTTSQAHESRVIELYPPNTWSSEKLYYVGNPYDVGGGPTYHANSSGGADYGYESFNPSGTPLPSKCDSMVWTTGDALRFPGFNGSIIDGSPLGTPCGGGVNDYVYGLAGIRASGNSNNPANTSTFVNANSIYIDVDNNICRNTKTRIGDIDVFKCGCFSHASLCDSIKVTSMSAEGPKDTCCFKLTVNNLKPNYFTGIQLCASNGVSISDVSVLTGFVLNSYNATQATVVAAGGGTIPVGVKDIIKFCLSNYQNVTNQQIIVKYYGPNFEVVCMDTLRYNCTQKPKCIKVTAEAVCGPNGTYQMSFCVMSNSLIGWNVASFVLNAPGVTFTPSVFTGLNIPPGGMQCNFTTTVSGNVHDGQTLCFSVTAHALNAIPPINCCTDTVMLACVVLPTCVCNKVSANAVSVTSPDSKCCWKVNLTNTYSNTYFTGIQLDILTGGVVFGSITNPLGSGWSLNQIGSNIAQFIKINPGGTTIGAAAMLPTFCLSGITSTTPVPQIVVVKWLGVNGQVVCTDTLKLNCLPPVETDCAVLVNPKIECDLNSPGGYTFTFQVYNNTNPAFPINLVTLTNVTGGTLSQTLFTIPSINYGGTSGVLTASIFGALPGSQVCFYLNVHEMGANNNELNCCSHSQRYCFTMPECPDSCTCGPFNILYSVGHGPLLIKKCGDTLVVPSSPNLPIGFITSFQCVGTKCPAATVDWVLTGPQGFVTQTMNGVAATPGFTIPITNATFSISGVYTLTMTGHCGSHLCICVIKFTTEKACCQDVATFNQNIANNVSLVVDKAKCKIALNIGNLPNCDMIQNINWGEGPIDFGPYMAGDMPMHTYTGSATYIISYVAVEKNPVTGAICFEKLVRDTITLICNNTDTCRCGEFSSLFYRPSQGGATVQKRCGDTLNVVCTPQFTPVLSGVYNCFGSCPSSGVKWELRKVPGGTVLSSGSLGSTFSLQLLASYFTISGFYELTLIPVCGDKECPKCVFTLNVQSCETCQCLGFASMSFYNYTWQPIVKPAKCDSFYTLPCTTNGGPFYFHGNMLCSSKACLSDSVTWSIGQGGIKIASGTVALHMIGGSAAGHFDIVLNSALFTPGVAYNMTVTGKCGTQVCTCKINFNFAPCPCLCDNLKKDLLKGFKIVGSQPLTICKRTFMPISLCPKDVVTWTLNGVPVAGTTTGNNVKTITFPGSGIYTICMIVVRTDASGKVCEGKICQKVKVKCKLGGVDPNIAFCSDNKVLNGDFTEGAIAGHLDASGVISDWKLFPNVGDGFVFVDDSTGSGDAGHLVLNGGKANFGAVWQKVNLSPSTFTTFEYDFKNYLGESTPAGTVLEFRLEPDTLPGGPSQVLYTQSIKDTTTSWTSALLSVRVNPNQDYKYLIICVRNDNDTSKSVIGLDNLVICTGSVSGIDQTSLMKKIRIYPNPNPGIFTVELPTPATSSMKLRVTDLTGRLLLEKRTEEGNSIQTVKAGTLPDGLYFIQVVSEGKVVAMEKFVKQ